jgi:hypothetical protein
MGAACPALAIRLAALETASSCLTVRAHLVSPALWVLSPEHVIRADDLAQAMVDVVVPRAVKHRGAVFENRDTRAMVEWLHVLGLRANEMKNGLLRNDILVEDSACVVRYNSPGSARFPRCD